MDVLLLIAKVSGHAGHEDLEFPCQVRGFRLYEKTVEGEEYRLLVVLEDRAMVSLAISLMKHYRPRRQSTEESEPSWGWLP